MFIIKSQNFVTRGKNCGDTNLPEKIRISLKLEINTNHLNWSIFNEGKSLGGAVSFFFGRGGGERGRVIC